jgi:hypothetical protein
LKEGTAVNEPLTFRTDPYLEILKRKGDEHERRYLERLKRETGRGVGSP